MLPEVLLAVAIFIIILIIILYLLRDRVFPTPTPTLQVIDCAGEFGEYGECQPLQGECGPTARKRLFKRTQEAENGGTECTFPDGEEFIQMCDNTIECPPGPTEPPQPIDCIGTWTIGDCSTDPDGMCGPGLHVDSYNILAAAQNGGNDCPYPDGKTIESTCYSKNGPCPTESPPTVAQDCIGAFEFGGCSSDDTCGEGTRTKTYRRYQESANNGTNCPRADGYTEQEDCFSLKGACPVDPNAVNCIGSFEYGNCSTDNTCGPGKRTKTYQRYQQSANGGTDCPRADGYTEQEDCFSLRGSCPDEPTPVNCIGSFEYASCSTDNTCGPGKRTKTYKRYQQSANGGTDCPRLDGYTEQEDCFSVKGACPIQTTAPPLAPVNCIGSFEYGNCNTDNTCGPGTRTKTYRRYQESANGGTDCPRVDGYTEQEDCFSIKGSCPVDPNAVNCIGAFEYGTCDTDGTCGPGKRTKTYRRYQEAANGGTDCPRLDGYTEQEDCFSVKGACPVDPNAVNCIGAFEYGTCDTDGTCGPGNRTKTYRRYQEAANGGQNCLYPNGYLETETCFSSKGACPTNPPPQPVDCIGSFSQLSNCEPTCGSGTQYQTYSITTQPQNGGQACSYGENQKNTVLCNNGVCAQNCIMSQWSLYGSCDKPCGGGKKTRTRTVVQSASGEGTPCPTNLIETENCNTQTCAPDAQDCVFTTSYGECSKICGSGMKNGTYDILVAAVGNGQPCPTGTPTPQPCNTQACPASVNCEYTIQYVEGCSKPCGTGQQASYYNIQKYPENGGTPCPTGTPSPRACNTQTCAPVDCLVNWGDWSSCSKPCDSGTRTRTGTVVRDSEYGGATCPPLLQQEGCNTQSCAPMKDCWLGQAAKPHFISQGVMSQSDCDVIRTNNPSVTTIWADSKPEGCPIICEANTDPCLENVCIKDDQQPYVCYAFPTEC